MIMATCYDRTKPPPPQSLTKSDINQINPASERPDSGTCSCAVLDAPPMLPMLGPAPMRAPPPPPTRRCSRRAYRRALGIIEEMQSQGIQANVIIEEVQSQGVQANVITYNETTTSTMTKRRSGYRAQATDTTRRRSAAT